MRLTKTERIANMLKAKGCVEVWTSRKKYRKFTGVPGLSNPASYYWVGKDWELYYGQSPEDSIFCQDAQKRVEQFEALARSKRNERELRRLRAKTRKQNVK
jgi:hypothetical protein